VCQLAVVVGDKLVVLEQVSGGCAAPHREWCLSRLCMHSVQPAHAMVVCLLVLCSRRSSTDAAVASHRRARSERASRPCTCVRGDAGGC
jgi:hypothetical protein